MLTRRPFSVDIENIASLIVFRLHGDLDVDGAESLRTIVESRIQPHNNNIVFDMTDVPYINSRGVGVFAGFLRTITVASGRIFFIKPQTKVKNVLRVCSFDVRLHNIDSIDEALRIVEEDTTKME